MSEGAPYVGANVAGVDSSIYEPMQIPKRLLVAAGQLADTPSPLLTMTDEMKCKLKDYLVSRISIGVNQRDQRLQRFGDIDRAISTWQQLSPDDTERKRLEDTTGKTMALPLNLPILATHLDDLVSYFAEAIAPSSNPFFSAKGDQAVAALQSEFNADAIRRDYYGELCSALRSLLKYNQGGLAVEWDSGKTLDSLMAESGNRWCHLDPYNTFWDPTVKNPKMVSRKAEFAGTIETTNRIDLMRKAMAGEWVGLEDILCDQTATESISSYWQEPSKVAGIDKDGRDSRTAAGTSIMNWSAYNLGSGGGKIIDGFEFVRIYCWLIPANFGLLTNDERNALSEVDERIHPDSFIELWKFEVMKDRILSAEPVLERSQYLGGEPVEIPMYLTLMTQDQLLEAQRSTMELMKGFQSFASNMYNIFIQGMRKNVWGLTGYDSTMFDLSQLPNGEVVGIVPMRGMPGRDARAGLVSVTGATGVEQAMQVVGSTLQLKDQLFPSQAMPNQVAGIDRAISSQVSTVVQGSQRSMKTMLRILDSSMLLPTRLEAFRNYKRHKIQAAQNITDEQFSKLIGSGLESMEAERVTDALWKLLYAIVQNSESMQVYDVPKLLSYIGNVGNLSVDLGQFVRQQAQPNAAPAQG